MKRTRITGDALEAVRTIAWPLLTTEACLTEVLYLLGRSTGWPGQDALLRFVEDASLVVAVPSPGSQARARAFMRRFRDQPCDYADATLLVVSEDTGRDPS